MAIGHVQCMIYLGSGIVDGVRAAFSQADRLGWHPDRLIIMSNAMGIFVGVIFDIRID